MAYVNFDSVQNYYQRLVFQEIMRKYGDTELADVPGALEDIACLALNQLQPRYVRHSIDTAFYIPEEELHEMAQQVKDAVERAAEFVDSNPREPMSGSLPDSLG